MKLENLTKDEIKDILKQLLQRVEIDKKLVVKNLRFNDVYMYKGRYCINYFNGFEHKVCSISETDADISSEDGETNKELTAYYFSLLKSVFQTKEQEIVANL